MVSLPQELVDAIVDCVDDTSDNNAALKACALASRAFTAPSQRRLFRFLALTPHTLQKLSSGFPASPHLADYVHDLHIALRLNAKDPKDAMPRLFQLFRRVQRLVISSFGWQNWQWATLSLDLRTALVFLLRQPSLRCLALTRCHGVPVSLVRYALRSYQQVALLIDCAHVKSESEPDIICSPGPASSKQQSALEHLVLTYAPDTLGASLHALLLEDQACTASALPNLRHLCLGTAASGNLDRLDEIARKYSDSLEHLTINLWRYHNRPITITPPDTIRFLTIRASMPALHIPASIVNFIAQLSSTTVCVSGTPSPHPHLETLSVFLDAEYESDNSGMLCPRGFSDLDEALKSLPRLRELHFTIFCNASVRFERAVRTALPRINAAGLLRFSKLKWRLKHQAMVHFAGQ